MSIPCELLFQHPASRSALGRGVARRRLAAASGISSSPTRPVEPEGRSGRPLVGRPFELDPLTSELLRLIESGFTLPRQEDCPPTEADAEAAHVCRCLDYSQ